MSRNLGTTSCRICNASIVLEEKPRPATVVDCGAYFGNYPPGFMVANAHCYWCGAKYLAWVSHDFPAQRYGSRWQRDPIPGLGFCDLSFRHAFNDEPAPEDLPDPATLRALHFKSYMANAHELRRQALDLRHEADEAERQAKDGTSFWEAYRR